MPDLVPVPEPNAIDLFLSDSAKEKIEQAVPTETKRAYKRQWGRFHDWCSDHGRQMLPATGETLAEYVSHLVDEGLSPATIEQAIGTIRTMHTISGNEGQPNTRAALLVLRFHKRDRADNGRVTKKSPPITIPALRAMVETCDLGTLTGLRDRATLVLGVAMMGRRSELVSLHLEETREDEDGVSAYIRKSKTDQDAEGCEIFMPFGDHPETCPVRVVRAWREALLGFGEKNGRLLRSVTRWAKPGNGLSGDAVNRIVRRRAVAAGLDHADAYTAHSLRSGGATSAYLGGATIYDIARQGRWLPTSPVVLGYIRAVDNRKNNPMRGIGL
jgi:site-specific recombinase XerD